MSWNPWTASYSQYDDRLTEDSWLDHYQGNPWTDNAFNVGHIPERTIYTPPANRLKLKPLPPPPSTLGGEDTGLYGKFVDTSPNSFQYMGEYEIPEMKKYTIPPMERHDIIYSTPITYGPDDSRFGISYLAGNSREISDRLNSRHSPQRDMFGMSKANWLNRYQGLLNLMDSLSGMRGLFGAYYG